MIRRRTARNAAASAARAYPSLQRSRSPQNLPFFCHRQSRFRWFGVKDWSVGASQQSISVACVGLPLPLLSGEKKSKGNRLQLGMDAARESRGPIACRWHAAHLETCSCASLLPRGGSGPWPRMDELKLHAGLPPIVPVFEVICWFAGSIARGSIQRITSNYRQLEKDSRAASSRKLCPTDLGSAGKPGPGRSPTGECLEKLASHMSSHHCHHRISHFLNSKPSSIRDTLPTLPVRGPGVQSQSCRIVTKTRCPASGIADPCNPHNP